MSLHNIGREFSLAVLGLRFTKVMLIPEFTAVIYQASKVMEQEGKVSIGNPSPSRTDLSFVYSGCGWIKCYIKMAVLKIKQFSSVLLKRIQTGDSTSSSNIFEYF